MTLKCKLFICYVHLPKVKYPWTNGPSISPNTMVKPVRKHLYLYTGITFSYLE